MKFYFHGFTLRPTIPEDLPLAMEWTEQKIKAGFWLKQGNGRESFLVFLGQEPIAFFQSESCFTKAIRLHFQASPVASRTKILRGITALVPLIEQALCLRGMKAIFFTSHSLTMVAFMEKKLGYCLQPKIDGGADGVVMGKMLGPVARSK